MSTASNRHSGTGGGGDRTWVLVIAATGWVVLTAVAVLMATGTWSVGQAKVGGSTPSQAPGGGTLQPSDPAVPRPGGRLEPQPTDGWQTDPRPAPRAGREGLVYAGSSIALIPRQSTARDH